MKVHIMKRVFVNGTFDILHRGHLELLRYAKRSGYVYVGIDTDECVREKKGPSRPIHNQEDRKFFLENLKSVDEVIFFSSEDEFEELIKSLHPDIIIASKCLTAGYFPMGAVIVNSNLSDEFVEFSVTKGDKILSYKCIFSILTISLF